MRTIKITEEQARIIYSICEAINNNDKLTISTQHDSVNPSDIGKNLSDTISKGVSQGLPMDKLNVKTDTTINGKDGECTLTTNENIITPRQIEEMRLKKLKENSRVVKLNHFIK